MNFDFCISINNRGGFVEGLRDASERVIAMEDVHVVLIPFLAPGHMIPAIDFGKLVASRGAIVTIITTPLHVSRLRKTAEGLRMRLVELEFPCKEVGLPEGCESLNLIPSPDVFDNFYDAIDKLEESLERSLLELNPPPSCIVSDMWMFCCGKIAEKLKIPRFSFHSMGTFPLLCIYNISRYLHMSLSSDSENFVIPNLPHEIEISRSQCPGSLTTGTNRMGHVLEKIMKYEIPCKNLIVNSFVDLEQDYIENYEKSTGKKVWTIGPVSLYNEGNRRGENEGLVSENELKIWLDLQKPNSVVYACLGSLSRICVEQQIEIALGLEKSNYPFIWVIQGEGIEKWMKKEGFTERIKKRGLVLTDWAPQLMILSHESVGVFLTHCGWNSVMEGICAGVQMLTFPIFAEQFLNEKMVVQIQKIGLSLGARVPVRWGEEDQIGVLVKSEKIEECLHILLEEGEETKERMSNVKQLALLATQSVEKGGSSYSTISDLLDYIRNTAAEAKTPEKQ